MAEHHTAEEVEQQFLVAMGPQLGALFYRLWNECVWLHWRWSEYLILYGTKAESVELLNKAAPSFFRVVQDSLWETVLLHICRMTDPTESTRRPNLTLQALPPLVATEIRPRVESLVQQALDRCTFARDWRNRRIAHRDLALALGQSALPLVSASRQSVRAALESIVSTLNAVDDHYRNANTAYDAVPPAGNAEALLYVLQDGLDAEAERERALRRQFGEESPTQRGSKP